MADELQLVSASDVLNLRCFPVIKAPDQTTTAALAEVRMDAAYFQYQVIPTLMIASCRLCLPT